jgi:hypothetical protein
MQNEFSLPLFTSGPICGFAPDSIIQQMNTSLSDS